MAIFPGSAIPSAAADYDIDNSCRFNDGDTAYLSRTPTVVGNRKVCTLSLWIKRGNLGAEQQMFSVAEGPSTSTGRTEMKFDDSDRLEWKLRTDPGGTTLLDLLTDRVFRDVGAWYHLVFVLDTTESVEADRAKIYVNNEQLTDFSTETYPTLNVDTLYNMTYLQVFGKYAPPDQVYYYDGYLAEFYCIDGTAYTPSDFGTLKSTTNQWIPKDASGLTFGTNGFYQKYSSDVLANSFADSALHKIHTVTAYGSAVTSTDQYKFGTASYFGEGDGDYIKAPSSPDWNFGTGEFTIEFWARFDTLASDMEFMTHLNGGSDDWVIWWNSPTNGITFNSINQGSHTGWAIDTWYHVAIVRVGTTVTIYKDGVSVASGTDSTDFDEDVALYIGETQTPPTEGFEGYLDEIRISNIARYVGAFTPATSAFTSDQYTKLLLHCDGADDGTTFTDSADSAPAHYITAVGNVANTRAVKKIGDSSIIFDGSGDTLTIPTSSDFTFGTDDFTVEAWINFASVANGGIFFFTSGATAGVPYFQYYSSALVFGINDVGVVNTYSWSPSADTWYHVAASRSGTTCKLFIDGSEVDSDTNSTDFGSDGIQIGYTGAGNWNGYMDEIRFSDSARYTGAFTPQTTEFTADANTKLLIHSNWDGGLGADSSGNYNTFTPTNLVATDQMVDVPTNNFATMNPLDQWQAPTFSEGNLKISSVTGGEYEPKER